MPELYGFIAIRLITADIDMYSNSYRWCRTPYDKWIISNWDFRTSPNGLALRLHMSMSP
jgi:hypothetical protein